MIQKTFSSISYINSCVGSIGNSKVGAVEKHEKAVTYKKEKFGLGFNEKGNIGVVKEDENELYNWKVRNKGNFIHSYDSEKVFFHFLYKFICRFNRKQ